MSARLIALTGVLVGTLVACSASTADFRDDAEAFLVSDEVFNAYAIDFGEPSCTEPPSTDVGQVVSCTAVGDDGTAYAFTLRITGENELTLEAIAFADAGTGAPSDPPPPSDAPATSPASGNAEPGTSTTAPATSAPATSAPATTAATVPPATATSTAPATTAAATTSVAAVTTTAPAG